MNKARLITEFDLLTSNFEDLLEFVKRDIIILDEDLLVILFNRLHEGEYYGEYRDAIVRLADQIAGKWKRYKLDDVISELDI